jgi:hypothetical protein
LKILLTLTLFTFVGSAGVAYARPKGTDSLKTSLSGRYEARKFTVETLGDHLAIDGPLGHQELKRQGSFIGAVVIADFDKDGKDEIAFLDMQGASVGGDLRFFSWTPKGLDEIVGSYFANDIKTIEVNGKSFLCLLQKQGSGAYEVDKIIGFREKKLEQVGDKKKWLQVINSLYLPAVDNAESAKAKSLYYAFIADAFLHIGDKKMSAKYSSLSKKPLAREP